MGKDTEANRRALRFLKKRYSNAEFCSNRKCGIAPPSVSHRHLTCHCKRDTSWLTTFSLPQKEEDRANNVLFQKLKYSNLGTKKRYVTFNGSGANRILYEVFMAAPPIIGSVGTQNEL
jgi:hypothetical protein